MGTSEPRRPGTLQLAAGSAPRLQGERGARAPLAQPKPRVVAFNDRVLK